MRDSDPVEPIPPEQAAAIHQFAQSAEAFCALIEHSGDEQMSDAEFAKRCASALVTLYRDALALPDCYDLPDFGNHIRTPNSHRNFDDHLRKRFGSNNHDDYWDYDPSAVTPAGILHVSMDLSETYDDIDDGLYLYRLGTVQAILNAGWEWQFKFMIHWGRNHNGALPALIKIIADDQEASWHQQDQEEGDDDDSD